MESDDGIRIHGAAVIDGSAFSPSQLYEGSEILKFGCVVFVLIWVFGFGGIGARWVF